MKNERLDNMQEENNDRIMKWFAVVSSMFAGFLIAMFMIAWLITK